MDILLPEQKWNIQLHDMVEQTKEEQKKDNPVFSDTLTRTTELVGLYSRKKVLHDAAKAEKIKQVFLQNYKKINPYNKSL